MGRARIGSSDTLSFSGAFCGVVPVANNGPASRQGVALNVSPFVAVPLGGAAIDCARGPHIGATAKAEEAQPSETTNAVKVHSRTNQTCRE